MSQFDWEDFLKAGSRKLIAEYWEEMRSGKTRRWHPSDLSHEEIEAEWLWSSGASDTQITEAESRLGVTLPDSYKSFLKVTNGLLYITGMLPLMPVEEIEWFQTLNANWIESWEELPERLLGEEYFTYDQDWRKWEQPINVAYMQSTLQISERVDSEVLLLNPLVIHNSEWEAWFFSSRYAGINRWRSFAEMMDTLGIGGIGNFWA